MSLAVAIKLSTALKPRTGNTQNLWLKREAEKNGAREWPIIAYADFTDYLVIISKRDNWREVFEPHFGRSEDVRESLQRLQPIRIDAAHARLITQEDELLLYVETKRLMSVLKKGN